LQGGRRHGISSAGELAVHNRRFHLAVGWFSGSAGHAHGYSDARPPRNAPQKHFRLKGGSMSRLARYSGAQTRKRQLCNACFTAIGMFGHLTDIEETDFAISIQNTAHFNGHNRGESAFLAVKSQPKVLKRPARPWQIGGFQIAAATSHFQSKIQVQDE
jgi:hypothetical protein